MEGTPSRKFIFILAATRIERFFIMGRTSAGASIIELRTCMAGSWMAKQLVELEQVLVSNF
jgi:hypothetical protein